MKGFTLRGVAFFLMMMQMEPDNKPHLYDNNRKAAVMNTPLKDTGNVSTDSDQRHIYRI